MGADKKVDLSVVTPRKGQAPPTPRTERPKSLIPAFSPRRDSDAFPSDKAFIGGGQPANPDNFYKMWFTHAVSSYKRERYGTAVLEYGHALKAKPGSKAALLARARCYVLLGDLEKARKDAEATLEDDKDYVPGLLCMADILYALGKFNMSKIYYSRGLKLKPANEPFLRGIQKVEETLLRMKEA